MSDSQHDEAPRKPALSAFPPDLVAGVVHDFPVYQPLSVAPYFEVTHRATEATTENPRPKSPPTSDATVVQATVTIRQTGTVVMPLVTRENNADMSRFVRPRNKTDFGSWLVIVGIVLVLAGTGIYLWIRSGSLG